MKCDRCLGEIALDEPVYRVLHDSHWHMGHEACAPKMGQRWRKPVPCHRCGRLIYRERPPRKGFEHLFCGTKCRQVARDALYRLSRERVDQRCPSCGEPFSPRRPDAKFCSPRCKQKAHRKAHRVPAVSAE